jgi:hypothetical protein
VSVAVRVRSERGCVRAQRAWLCACAVSVAVCVRSERGCVRAPHARNAGGVAASP